MQSMQNGSKTGAQHLLDALIAGGVDTCFTNPGTSEMHFVSALDQTARMRCILCLFEGVATGAGDGYGRMLRKPAATLLHLGPGLANGLANLHNARRAGSPVVNIVGEHAREHIQYDSPLTTDIEAIARPFSRWVGTCRETSDLSAMAGQAIHASMSRPGGVATLILPADIAWRESSASADAPRLPSSTGDVDEAHIDETVRLLAAPGKALIIVGADGLLEKGLAAAGRIAAATGVDLLAPTHCGRIERGAGRVDIARIPYPVDQALDRLRDYDTVILAGANDPVAFFAYPGKPSRLLPEKAQIHRLARREDNVEDALQRLADRVSPSDQKAMLQPREKIDAASGPLSPEVIARGVAVFMPEGTIVADESISVGRDFFRFTRGAPAHSWLPTASGSIGIGLPMSIGAAIACPDRPVINLQADGSAMYTIQSLWTIARENLNVVTVILANRGYAILRGEMRNVGLGNPGPRALDMLEIDRPAIGWVQLARSMGVEAERAEDGGRFNDLLSGAIARGGPFLIEAQL
jgi:acetolactate synthase-1/2/3 large subunit